MIRNKPLLISLSALFVGGQITLGVLLQTVGGRISIYMRYGVVILACLFCFLFVDKTAAYLLTQLALICTVCADWFLVLPPSPNQLPGMLFFSVTQTAYFLRIYLADPSPKRRRLHLILRGSLTVLVLTATIVVLGKGTDAVALVSMFYYANLVMNIAFAFAEGKKHLLLALGLALFLCCDTVVGLAFMNDYIAISKESLLYRITHPSFDLVWAFYVPSQTLIALSLLPPRFHRQPFPLRKATGAKT